MLLFLLCRIREFDYFYRFSFISHFICNAGTANFTGMDFVEATKQLLLEDFVAGVTHPRYKLQRVGELSRDGLGYIWQSNVFGHYVLVRYVSGAKFQTRDE